MQLVRVVERNLVEVLLSGKTLSVLLQATVVLLHTVLLLTAGMCQVVIRLLGTRVVHNYCDIHVFSVTLFSAFG